ncbi:MAG: hypothetical protein IKG42_06770 [Clostridia bacterium]|nr:hypothetical protein [Clostridia bacterium]
MRLNDIVLDNIKIVLFDFDETLAIHKDKDYIKHRNESEGKRLGYYLNAYKNPETFYEDIEPCVKSEILCNFINELRSKNIKMYCLSGMKFSFHFKAKQNFINKHYGDDIELISASSQQLKLDGIKIIQELNNCNLDEILFIEDLEDTIKYLNDNGVKTIDVNDLEEK